MTLLVRDEEEILENHLSYHFAQGVDHVVVTDNRSTDGTPDLLERFRREGRVSVIQESGDDYNQSRWVTRMARLAADELGADWVIHSDADEFWWPKSGDFRRVFADMPADVGVWSVDRSNFLPAPGDGPFHQRMIVREAVSYSIFGGPIPPKVCHRASPDASVGQGNHAVTGVSGRTLGLGSTAPLFILHYPMRSYEQFERKIVLGGAAYERNTIEPWETGSGWRTRFEDYKSGRLPEWWARQVPDRGAIEAGLGDGTLVTDRRLQAFFAEGRATGAVVVDAMPAVVGPPTDPSGSVRLEPSRRRRSRMRRALRSPTHIRRRFGRLAVRLKARSR